MSFASKLNEIRNTEIVGGAERVAAKVLNNTMITSCFVAAGWMAAMFVSKFAQADVVFDFLVSTKALWAATIVPSAVAAFSAVDQALTEQGNLYLSRTWKASAAISALAVTSLAGLNTYGAYKHNRDAAVPAKGALKAGFVQTNAITNNPDKLIGNPTSGYKYIARI